MSMQDPVADMLTRVRNGCMSEKTEVEMPSSKMKEAIASVLKEEGYIADFKVEGDIKKTLSLDLKYYKGSPVIEGLTRISKPSCRIYCGSQELPRVRNGLGIAILSTPQGVISNRTAAKSKVGGEILCHIW